MNQRSPNESVVTQAADPAVSTLGQRLQGFAAAVVLKTLLGTLRWDKEAVRACKLELESGKQRIFAFWHGRLLGLPGLGEKLLPASGRRLCVLISRHSDGRLIAEAVRWFGIESVAGSSSKGGSEALRSLVSVAEKGFHLGITPDGPRGPRHECKFGVVALSQKTQLAIVPATYAAARFWRLRSWDGMVIPKPFSRAVLLLGEPITVAAEEDLESARIRVESALKQLEVKADAFWSPV